MIGIAFDDIHAHVETGQEQGNTVHIGLVFEHQSVCWSRK